MKYQLLSKQCDLNELNLVAITDVATTFETVSESDNHLAIVVQIKDKSFIFIPESRAEAEQLVQAYSNPTFQREMEIAGQVTIQSAVISHDYPLLKHSHNLSLKKDPDTCVVEIPSEDTDERPVVINVETPETVSCRSALRQLASFLSATPEAALLSVGLGSLIHRGLEGHLSQLARWVISSTFVLAGAATGTWYMRNYYGKNLTVDAVDRMTEEEVQSTWQRIGGNVLCTLWAAYEAADGAIAGLSLFTGEKAAIAAVVTATAKFAKTLTIERPRVMHEKGQANGFVYNISRGLQELAPPMVMGLHTKAVLDLLKIFIPKLATYGLGASAPIALLTALTIGQAGAYITAYYDGAEGSKYQGRNNRAEWSAAHASADKSLGFVNTSLSLFQTGDALPEIIRAAVAKLGGDSVKQERFVNWILTATQTVGLGALYSNAVIEFFRLNLPKVLEQGGGYLEAGVSVAMMLSAFCVAKGKVPTAMRNEYALDPAIHPELIFERSVRSLMDCGCCTHEEQSHLQEGLLGSADESRTYHTVA